MQNFLCQTLISASASIYFADPLMAKQNLFAGDGYVCLNDKTKHRCFSVGSDFAYYSTDPANSHVKQVHVTHVPASIGSNPKFFTHPSAVSICALGTTGFGCWGNFYDEVSVYRIPPNIGRPKEFLFNDLEACAIPSNLSTPDQIQCWGANFDRMSTNGTYIVPNMQNPRQMISIGGGGYCAITDLGVQCWGSGVFTQSDLYSRLIKEVKTEDVKSLKPQHGGLCYIDKNHSLRCMGAYWVDKYPFGRGPLENPDSLHVGAWAVCAFEKDKGYNCQWPQYVTYTSDPTYTKQYAEFRQFLERINIEVLKAKSHQIVTTGVRACLLLDGNVVCSPSIQVPEELKSHLKFEAKDLKQHFWKSVGDRLYGTKLHAWNRLTSISSELPESPDTDFARWILFLISEHFLQGIESEIFLNKINPAVKELRETGGGVFEVSDLLEVKRDLPNLKLGVRFMQALTHGLRKSEDQALDHEIDSITIQCADLLGMSSPSLEEFQALASSIKNSPRLQAVLLQEQYASFRQGLFVIIQWFQI